MATLDHFKSKYPQLFGDRLISFECGKGWNDLIERTFEKIKDSGTKIVQLKEKFGGLRIYADNCHEKVSEILKNTEAESFKTCESCGTKEKVKTEGRWLKTLCPTCRAKEHWWLEEEELRIDVINWVKDKKPVFELAPQEKVNALDKYVDRILEVLGHPEALVTDESTIWDFLALEPERLKEISEKLGVKVETGDYLIDVAASMKLKGL